jgi:alkanesulfonate monooxygenase SsuD/methylene tetrahydromethanopterin reductase-like flavin-dependent oxidoreductase (luciferase family)
MRYGISIPNFGAWAEPWTMVELARDAEAAGWDGFFLWDHIRFSATPLPVQDPWVLLTAIAAQTERILLGPMVTPLPRRRPWVVARQAVSLDHLSNGRVLLGVGIGEPVDVEFGAFGDPTDRRVRAEMLDEALAIITGLWSGEEFSFSGTHYRIGPMRFLPRPVQQPRIPIIVAGYLPNPGPIRRAARWDGMYPLSTVLDDEDWPEKFAALVAELRERHAEHAVDGMAFEILDGGETPGTVDPAESERLGATWWIESLSPWRYGWDDSERWPEIGPVRERIGAGPPSRPSGGA